MQEPKEKFTKSKNSHLILGVIIIIVISFITYGKISEYKSDISTYKTLVSDYESEIQELNDKLEKAEPWFNMDETQQQEIIDKQEAELKAKEEQEKAEKEAKEKEEQKISNTSTDSNYKFDYHYESDNPTYIGNGVTMSRCPYCGGRWVDDYNPNSYSGNSHYCMDCGVGLEE